MLLAAAEALASGTAMEFIHIKEIEVDVDPTRGQGVLELGERTTARTLKSQ